MADNDHMRKEITSLYCEKCDEYVARIAELDHERDERDLLKQTLGLIELEKARTREVRKQLEMCREMRGKDQERIAQVEQAFLDLEREKDSRIAQLEAKLEHAKAECRRVWELEKADNMEQLIVDNQRHLDRIAELEQANQNNLDAWANNVAGLQAKIAELERQLNAATRGTHDAVTKARAETLERIKLVLSLEDIVLPKPKADRSQEFTSGYYHGGTCMRIAVASRLNRALGDE